jgi:hypothetical protein
MPKSETAKAKSASRSFALLTKGAKPLRKSEALSVFPLFFSAVLRLCARSGFGF